jgi:hypothetical protein
VKEAEQKKGCGKVGLCSTLLDLGIVRLRPKPIRRASTSTSSRSVCLSLGKSGLNEQRRRRSSCTRMRARDHHGKISPNPSENGGKPSEEAPGEEEEARGGKERTGILFLFSSRS